MIYQYIVYFFLFSVSCLNGQAIFDSSYVHEIRISLSVQNYEELLSSNYDKSSDTIKAPYAKADISIDGVKLSDVGLRYKGNSSYQKDMTKKSIKIDINEFVKGQSIQGIQKFNLHNSFADASYLRDPLSYYLFMKMGVKAPRTSFAKVYINQDYKGLYQIVEQVDASFVEGSIFKNKGSNNLVYRGDDVGLYKENIDLKTKKSDSDWKQLVTFLEGISTLNGAEFEKFIETKFKIESFIKALVVYTATNNYDSILKTGRNWYLNLDSISGKFLWIPWDGGISFSALFPARYKDCDALPDFLWETKGRKEFQFYDDSDFQAQISRTWDFGDGNKSIDKDPSHRYTKHGTYKVCLELSMLDYCASSKCVEISTREKRLECGTRDDKPNDFKYLKTIDFKETCCEEWNEVCEFYYQGIERPSTFDFSFFPVESRRIFVNKILSNKKFRTLYRDEMCFFLSEVFTKEKMEEFIKVNRSLIREAVSTDPFTLQSYKEFERVSEISEEKSNLQYIVNSRITALINEGHCN